MEADVARDEVTGRKPRNNNPHAAYTITEFCEAHRISEAMYFKMRALGQGPNEMKVGARRLISFESAARWRAEREACNGTAAA
jgi:hypothetical protein